jgi:hypothetical protein
MKRRPVDRALGAVLLAAALALGAGCSSTGPKNGTGLPGGAPCAGPLGVVGAQCPAAFDGTLLGVACPAGLGQSVFSCAEGLLLLSSGGGTAYSCVYDPSSHALVGASVASDAPVFCNGRTYQELAGTQVAPACVLGPVVRTRLCPLDGSDAGPGTAPDAGDAAPAGGADGGPDDVVAATDDGGAHDGADGDGVSE